MRSFAISRGVGALGTGCAMRTQTQGGDVKLTTLGWLLIAVAGLANAQDKPNVVIMLGDNGGYGDIGAFGGGEIRGMPTPRIDSIAAHRR